MLFYRFWSNYPFQVKKFLADVDDQLAQVNDFRAELKTNQPFGALPDTAEKQYTEFVVSEANRLLCLCVACVF